MRYHYALSDTFAGDDPKEITAGFANTKIPIAFRSSAARDEWLRTTNLTTARKITRELAVKYAKKEAGEYYGSKSVWCRPCRIYGTGEGYSAEYVILAESSM